MHIQVLYFGVLKDLFQAEGESLQLPDGSTAGEALSFLRERASNQSAPWNALAIAVNREYASSSAMLREGDELALLPPVSGGSCQKEDL